MGRYKEGNKYMDVGCSTNATGKKESSKKEEGLKERRNSKSGKKVEEK